MARNDNPTKQFETLDRDLDRLSTLELAASHLSRPLAATGIALAFVVLAGLLATVMIGGSRDTLLIVIASVFGAYMALNIGANDVANNMGPAVGANALSMSGAIAIAAICETAGALIAGGDVVTTIAQGLVVPATPEPPAEFAWAMLAALLAAALWVNLATVVGAPVSTTHSVVGGVVGAGSAAVGLAAVNWAQLGMIALGWLASPLMGAVIAVAVLWIIETRVIRQPDKIAAAQRWVPVLVGVMAGAFATYLMLKALSHVVSVDLRRATVAGLVVAVGTWMVMIPVIRQQSAGLENRNKSLKTLFGIPLIVSAALLSFAHGANDVANAVGPLAGIVQALRTNTVGGTVAIPFWIMLIGAVGISFGLFLFGPRLIRIVGREITKLNPIRAYCIALSAAITVIFASWLGLPVSSTHIAVGAVFGVGFFREWSAARRMKIARAALEDQPRMGMEERRRRKLVRRSHFMTIAAAWLVTVPAAALLSAVIYWGIDALVG